jgi:GntP family gluconate:H+ symporter
MSPLLELLLLIVSLVAGIIFFISILKVHPVITLAIASVITGLFFGFNVTETLFFMGTGFWKVLTGIGLVIALGAILGTLMESSGALDVLIAWVLRVFGQDKPLTALSVLGLVVGIPVFCDSGFIILASTAKRIQESQGIRHGLSSVALAGGLYTAHTLIPPTPGPVAAAGNLNMADQLGLVILSGFLVSLVLVFILVITCRWLYGAHPTKVLPLLKRDKLSYNLLSPILLALGLISLGSVISLISLNETVKDILRYLTHPVTALGLACVVAWLQITGQNRKPQLVRTGFVNALPVILITAMGGAFGYVLRESPVSEILEETFRDSGNSIIGIFLIAYVVAFVLKTAQGSSTASIVISSSIMFPLVMAASLSPWESALLITSIGSGAMAVSHANDSFFWVVTKFSELTVRDSYLKFSLTTFILSMAGLGASLLLLIVTT